MLFLDLLFRAPAPEGASNFCTIIGSSHFGVLSVSLTPREVVDSTMMCIQRLVLDFSALDESSGQIFPEYLALGLETLLDDWLQLLVWFVSDNLQKVLRRLERVILVQYLVISWWLRSTTLYGKSFKVQLGVALVPIVRVLVIALSFLMLYLVNDDARAVKRVVFVIVVVRVFRHTFFLESLLLLGATHGLRIAH